MICKIWSESCRSSVEIFMHLGVLVCEAEIAPLVITQSFEAEVPKQMV